MMEGESQTTDIADSNKPQKPAESTPVQPQSKETRSHRARLPWLGWKLPLASWTESDEEAAEEEGDEHEAMVRELQHRIRDLEGKNRELRKRAQTRTDEAYDKSRALFAEQDANRQLHEALMSLQSERDSMRLSIQKQETQIRQVQQAAFEGIGGESWAAGDDSTVSADLENMHSRIKAWARKHAVDEMSSLSGLAGDEYASFIRLLAEVVRLEPKSTAAKVMEILASERMNKKSTALCLQGLLAQFLYANIIGKPFFAFDGAREALESVYARLEEVNVHEAQIWRSKTLRLLATPAPKIGGNEQPTYSVAQESECRGFAEEFCNSPARYLIRPSSAETLTQCAKELDLIFQHAGELSHKLWSRRTVLRVMALPELSETPFTSRSELMKAHPLHRLYEDDDRCDGWRVGVVAHPAVLGHGSSDGKDYTTGRVWMKAEVWLTEGV